MDQNKREGVGFVKKTVSDQNSVGMVRTADPTTATNSPLPGKAEEAPQGAEGCSQGRKSSRRMGQVEQQEFLQLLEKGCTAAFACHQMGRTMSSLWKTLQRNGRFRQAFEENLMLMNQRVEAALYKAALKGNVSAQTLWLRNRPPPGWKSNHKRSEETQGLKDMTDEELFRFAEQAGCDLPEEFGEGTGISSGESKSSGVSTSAADSGRG